MPLKTTRSGDILSKKLRSFMKENLGISIPKFVTTKRNKLGSMGLGGERGKLVHYLAFRYETKAYWQTTVDPTVI